MSSTLTLKAVILEDEARHREILQALLEKYCPDVHVVATAQNIAEGVATIEQHKPDLVFSDVELKDGDCFELLNRIEELNFALIFTTAHDHYAIRAIKFSALDYLLKPLMVNELREAVAKARRRAGGSDTDSRQLDMLREYARSSGSSDKDFHRIALPVLDGFTIVDVDSIVRLEAEGNCTKVYMRNSTVNIVTKRLQVYEELLQDYNFVRIHHSHVVNFKHVTRYVKGKGGHVVMSDGTIVDVAVRKKDAFLEKLTRA